MICVSCGEEYFYIQNRKIKSNLCEKCRNKDLLHKWYLKHKDEQAIYHKIYYKKYSEKIKNDVDKYRKTINGKDSKKKEREKNREYYLKYNKDYSKSSMGRVKDKIKYNKRKRELGFIPLNNYFKGSCGHHLNKEDVVFIPKYLHLSVWHRLSNPITMIPINYISNFFLLQQNIEYLNKLFNIK